MDKNNLKVGQLVWVDCKVFVDGDARVMDIPYKANTIARVERIFDTEAFVKLEHLDTGFSDTGGYYAQVDIENLIELTPCEAVCRLTETNNIKDAFSYLSNKINKELVEEGFRMLDEEYHGFLTLLNCTVSDDGIVSFQFEKEPL